MNAHELSQRLADGAATVAEHLLPGGKRAGREWKAGSVGGEEGKSLSVAIGGDRRGVWRDFATGEGGDLLDLWVAVRRLSLAEAMVEAKAYLGIRDAMPPRERPSYKRPAKPPGQTPRNAVRDWLAGRGLTEQTIADFKIAEQLRDGKAYAVFPYLRDGELVNVKYRNVAEKRDMRQEAGAEPCLFGWHLVDPQARSIVITEGELDAMTLHQVGFPALSVNAGASNHQWIENDWDRLERFSEIFVCFDNDHAGQKASAEIVQRLGIERCKVVVFGTAKDANDYLASGAERVDFDNALQTAKPLDPAELVEMASFYEALRPVMYPAAGAAPPPLPMLLLGDEYHQCFEFRPGEYSAWTGINGHGKSLMLNQVLLGLMAQGERVCVFSGELQGITQAKRLLMQATGVREPTKAYFDVVQAWLRGRMWVFDLVGTAPLARLLEVFRYAAKRYGITHFVIDSLMTTDVPEDGPGALSAQKKAVQEIVGFAKAFRAHVHLVAHPRKGRDESHAPGKLDVSGSGKITDGADNIFSVWAALREKEDPENKPDALLHLLKQRNGEVQNRKFWTYFNPRVQQYCANSARRPMVFVPFQQHIASQLEVET